VLCSRDEREALRQADVQSRISSQLLELGAYLLIGQRRMKLSTRLPASANIAFRQRASLVFPWLDRSRLDPSESQAEPPIVGRIASIRPAGAAEGIGREGL
jgi:hypothetical protein